MNFYEHTLVAKQDLSTADLDKIHDKYNDIINKSAGEVIKIDVKSESTRRTGKFAGYKITRQVSNSQEKMGVKLLMVSETGKCYFYKDD